MKVKAGMGSGKTPVIVGEPELTIEILLNRIEWGLAVTSLEFTMKAYREYDYRAVWPDDPAQAYKFRTEQIERARATKNDIAALARLIEKGI